MIFEKVYIYLMHRKYLPIVYINSGEQRKWQTLVPTISQIKTKLFYLLITTNNVLNIHTLNHATHLWK